MTTCQGVIVDDSGGAPLSGIVVSIMQNGSGQIEAPGLTDTTDSGGNFFIDNVPNADGDPTVFILATDPSGKYLESTNSYTPNPGKIPMSTSIITKIPAWVWYLLGAVILYGGYIAYRKGYFNKLLK